MALTLFVHRNKKSNVDHHRSVCSLTVEVKKRIVVKRRIYIKKNQLLKDVFNTNKREKKCT
jgi:hypothetical protein